MAVWTDRQLDAIEDRGQSLLVSAAAGSGKTAVLVERIKRHIIEGAASLDRMLIVTFTKAAASEMRERLRTEIGDELEACKDEEKRKLLKKQLSFIGRAEICTFDSFAQKIFKSYYHIIGADPSMKVCDAYRSSILKSETMEELFSEHYEKQDKDFIDFLDHYSSSKSDQNARTLILNLYEYIDTLPHPFEFLEGPCFSPEGLLDTFAEFALNTIEKAAGYCRILGDIFTAENMLKCAEIVLESWSELDSIISQIRAGYKKEGIERFLSFSFPKLSAPKDEKEKKDALSDIVDGYWTNGARDTVNDFKKAYQGISIGRLQDELQRLETPIKEYRELTRDFALKYSDKKKKMGLMDFSDGEHMALEILESEEVRKECREKYLQIFVDEYQDCNPLQESLIESISSGNNVFTVGDVKQSIYRFRHAEPNLFLARRENYKNDENKGKVIDLNSNFRSKAPVIDFVNRVFSNLMTKESCNMEYDDDAALREGAPYKGSYLYEPSLYIADTQDDEDADPEVLELKGNEQEALLAVDIIKEYHGKMIRAKNGEDRPLEFRDMAILLRSAKTKAEIYYEALTKAGIPVYLERNEGYFDTPEIQVAMNLLRIIDNPRQDVPLISVLYFPSFGFSTDELANIRIDARESGKRRMSFYDAFKYVSTKDGELSQKCRDFLEKISEWKVKASALPLADFIWQLLYESGINTFAACLSQGEQRLANLRALADKASEFERNAGSSIFSFISYVDAIQGSSNAKVSIGQSGIVSEEENVVRIMTVHKSKGLEFPFVLFASCGGRLSAGKDSSRAVFDKNLGTAMYLTNPKTFSYVKPLSFKIIENAQKREELAEEIRLLYVAATRARDIFVMSASVKDADRFLSKREIFRVKGSSCSNFSEMVLPAVDFKNVKVKRKGNIDLSSFEKNMAEEEKLKNEFENGFKIDESKLSIPLDEIKRRIHFDYSPRASESEKRKYSVSELAEKEINKGKAERKYEEEYPVPKFISGTVKLSAAAKGTAYHTLMEHIPFTLDGKSAEDISAFAQELKEKGILSPEECDCIDTGRVEAFFKSSLGKRVCNASVLKKETPFVIKHMYEGREVLVQGTIDCWFEEDGKLYLLDYKSNYVAEDELESELERLKKQYTPQLLLYKEALEEIKGKKVCGSYLYLFAADKYISIGD